MENNKFKDILGKKADDLDKLRKEYFRFIEKGIISGYNLFLEEHDYSTGDLFLNYLHSDLKPDDEHFKEILSRLKKDGFLDLEGRILINHQLVDRGKVRERETVYLMHPEWENAENTKYFTLRGSPLSLEEAHYFEGDLVGESLQYDLLIKIKNTDELRTIINLFKKYASKNKLDRKGRKIIKDGEIVLNETAVYRAWEIPLLTCKASCSRKPKNLPDFLSVFHFSIGEDLGGTPIILSTLVKDKRKELIKELGKKKQFSIDKVYSLRLFVEDYIDRGNSQTF